MSFGRRLEFRPRILERLPATVGVRNGFTGLAFPDQFSSLPIDQSSGGFLVRTRDGRLHLGYTRRLCRRPSALSSRQGYDVVRSSSWSVRSLEVGRTVLISGPFESSLLSFSRLLGDAMGLCTEEAMPPSSFLLPLLVRGWRKSTALGGGRQTAFTSPRSTWTLLRFHVGGCHLQLTAAWDGHRMLR